MTDKQTDLVGLTQNEIFESLISNNLVTEKEKFRAKQLWKWLYVKGAKSFFLIFLGLFAEPNNH